MKVEKENEIQIIIDYKCKSRLIKEFTTNKFNITFGDILNFYYTDIKNDFQQYQLKSKYFFNQKELENTDILLNLLMNKNIDIHNITQIKVDIFLEEIYHLFDKELPDYTKIIIPIKNESSLELYIYAPGKGRIDIEEYYKNISEEYSLYKINEKTAFCNTINYLFLSGGEYNNEIINNFWIIDNSNYSIKLAELPTPKSNHSMHNINNEYIIIIGGNGTKTYLYNIKNNSFLFWENTNNIHLNPYITLFNNYIYCFSEQNDEIKAERKKFSEEKNIWENIPLNLIDSNNDLHIISNNNILVILGNKKYYEFDAEKNIIKKIKINDDENFDIDIGPSDKNFYKLNKYYSACIPRDFYKEKILYILNKKTRKVHKMHFNAQSPNIKYQYEDSNDIVNNENIILIKVKFENNNENEFIKVNSLKTFLKNLDENNKKKNNLNDEIIINEISLPKKEENQYEKKSSKIKINLILPKNVIFEQFIHRTSDLEDEHPKLEIDVDNLGNGVEDIFTPIKRDLIRPIAIKDINNEEKTKEESISFEQLPLENQNNDKALDISREKAKKKHFNFLIPKESFDEQFITREIKTEPLKNNDEDEEVKNSINDYIKNDKENEENKENKENEMLIEDYSNNNINNELNDEEEPTNEEKKNLDLFISMDAFRV